MNAAAIQQRLEKARAYAEHAREEIQEALFLLAALESLIRDEKIIKSMSRTYAAHALNLLQWTLFRTATINLCSAVLDKDERSGSIRTLMDMLDSEDLVTCIRAERTRPLPGGRRPAKIDPQFWTALERERQERERTEAEATFDDELPEVRPYSRKCATEPSPNGCGTRGEKFWHMEMSFLGGAASTAAHRPRILV